jgi:hypothetical protein
LRRRSEPSLFCYSHTPSTHTPTHTLSLSPPRRKDCALLAHLDKATQSRLRKTIISSIHCTDMTNHSTMTQDFRNHGVEFDPDSEADRLMLAKVRGGQG